MKILRSRKALSPVIASIILIAVTVAVSIAVAAWMGALSFSFMNNGEQVQLGSPYGWTNGGSVVYVRVSCPGGNAITVTAIRINSVNCPTFNGTGASLTIAPNTSIILTIVYNNGTANIPFASSYQYTFVITTAKNNEFQTTGMVP